MDDGESSRRNRKPNYSRDEVLTIICGVQENKFNLLKKSCTVSSNKLKQAGWKAICDRLNFFNPDRQRTVDEVRKKWKDLSAQARNDLMCKRTIAHSAGNPGDADDSHGSSGGREQKEVPAGEFTPLILAILGEVGSIDMTAEDSGLLNIGLNSFSHIGDQQAEQEAIYDTVVIQKQEAASDSQQSQTEAELEDSDSRKRMRKPNYTKKDILTLIQGVSDNKFALLQKICTHTSNKAKTESWGTICQAINSYNPEVMRTTEELRKKWKDLSKQARQDLYNLKAAIASGHGKPTTPPGEFSALCLPILAEVGLVEVTAEEINALKANNVTTVISLHQAAGAEFVTTSQANVLAASMEKECDSFATDSAAFGTTGLIGAPTATQNINTADVSATGEFALSTLASVSASKLKEKLREKLVSGGPASQEEIQDFQAAQAELQAVGVEVRLIENPHPHHGQQPQDHKQSNQPGMDASGAVHQHHITLEDPSMISSVPSPAAAMMAANPNQPQQQQTQNGLPPGVTIQSSNGLQFAAPTPQQLFRAHIINNNGADSSNPLKRKLYSSNNNNSNGATISNIITSGGVSTIFPIPISIQQQPPAPSLSTPVTVLTGPSVVAGNISPTSPTTQWLSEKQALEREKLQAEVELLRLQRIKLRLEIEAMLQQRQPESCQLLEDYLK